MMNIKLTVNKFEIEKIHDKKLDEVVKDYMSRWYPGLSFSYVDGNGKKLSFNEATIYNVKELYKLIDDKFAEHLNNKGVIWQKLDKEAKNWIGYGIRGCRYHLNHTKIKGGDNYEIVKEYQYHGKSMNKTPLNDSEDFLKVPKDLTKYKRKTYSLKDAKNLCEKNYETVCDNSKLEWLTVSDRQIRAYSHSCDVSYVIFCSDNGLISKNCFVKKVNKNKRQRWLNEENISLEEALKLCYSNYQREYRKYINKGLSLEA